MADFSGHAARRDQGRTMTVNGLNGVQEAAAINTKAAALASYQNDTVAYPDWLKTLSGTGVNSNSGAYTLASIAGVGNQFNAFRPPGNASGSNMFLPGSAFSSRVFQLQVHVAALQQQISVIQKQRAEAETGNAVSTPQMIR